jgi:hypothetical protein
VSGIDYLERLGAELQAARRLRYEPAETFADVPSDVLEIAVRGLRAIAYSAETGARHLARIVVDRRRENPVPVATETGDPAPAGDTG